METADRQEIELLRRRYGKATDLIGRGTPDAVEAGRAIYRDIFTPDARFATSRTGSARLKATGPDQWVDVVRRSLERYTVTQHMIGTQIVEVDGDAATMESYVRAWHEHPDGSADVFIGAYIDRARRTPDGWRIHDMELRRDSTATVPSR